MPWRRCTACSALHTRLRYYFAAAAGGSHFFTSTARATWLGTASTNRLADIAGKDVTFRKRGRPGCLLGGICAAALCTACPAACISPSTCFPRTCWLACPLHLFLPHLWNCTSPGFPTYLFAGTTGPEPSATPARGATSRLGPRLQPGAIHLRCERNSQRYNVGMAWMGRDAAGTAQPRQPQTHFPLYSENRAAPGAGALYFNAYARRGCSFLNHFSAAAHSRMYTMAAAALLLRLPPTGTLKDGTAGRTRRHASFQTVARNHAAFS